MCYLSKCSLSYFFNQLCLSVLAKLPCPPPQEGNRVAEKAEPLSLTLAIEHSELPWELSFSGTIESPQHVLGSGSIPAPHAYTDLIDRTDAFKKGFVAS